MGSFSPGGSHAGRGAVGDKTIGAEMRRFLLYEFLAVGRRRVRAKLEDSAAIYKACRKVPNADPWLLHMLAGRAHVTEAWHHRGGEWAYK